MRGSTLLTAAVLVLAAGFFSLEKIGADEVGPVNADGMALPHGVDFATQIQPVLSARCMPCHFQGGIMYERLPFDQPKTITRLGEKLFTRIKDENDRKIIREFLAQPSTR